MTDFKVVDKSEFDALKPRVGRGANAAAYAQLRAGEDILVPLATGLATFRMQARVDHFNQSQRTVEGGILVRWTKKAEREGVK